jgi:hypothetical protein
MGAKIHRIDDIILFHCPGCGRVHPFDKRWAFNGNEEAPTFTPSLLVHAKDGGTECHSFVTDGRIQFLADSRHALAGQTVDLPDWTEESW